MRGVADRARLSQRLPVRNGNCTSFVVMQALVMTEAPQRDDSEACVLLEQYVELHNQQVVEGADGVDDLFTGDVDIDVEGTAISALRRYAMVT